MQVASNLCMLTDTLSIVSITEKKLIKVGTGGCQGYPIWKSSMLHPQLLIYLLMYLVLLIQTHATHFVLSSEWAGCKLIIRVLLIININLSL